MKALLVVVQLGRWPRLVTRYTPLLFASGKWTPGGRGRGLSMENQSVAQGTGQPQTPYADFKNLNEQASVKNTSESSHLSQRGYDELFFLECLCPKCSVWSE